MADSNDGSLKGTSEKAVDARNRITSTWNEFSKKSDDIYQLGIPMFQRLFEVKPETQKLFKFETTDEAIRTKKLKGHIKLLFDYIDYAVEHIEELDDMTATVIDLGTRHFYYGVKPEFYLAFGQCLLYAIEVALGKDRFTKVDYDSWMMFYHWIGGCIVKGIVTESTQKK